MPKIMIIDGSPRTNSNTNKLASYIEEIVKKEVNENDVSLYSLSKNPLPIYTGKKSDYEISEVRKFVLECQNTSAFIICTPEYHGAISGALKNALDFVGDYQFSNKETVILATSGGGKGGINALNNLRTILRSLNAFVLPNQCILDPYLFSESKYFGEENINKRLKEAVFQLNITNSITN